MLSLCVVITLKYFACLLTHSLGITCFGLLTFFLLYLCAVIALISWLLATSFEGELKVCFYLLTQYSVCVFDHTEIICVCLLTNVLFV